MLIKTEDVVVKRMPKRVVQYQKGEPTNLLLLQMLQKTTSELLALFFQVLYCPSILLYSIVHFSSVPFSETP